MSKQQATQGTPPSTLAEYRNEFNDPLEENLTALLEDLICKTTSEGRPQVAKKVYPTYEEVFADMEENREKFERNHTDRAVEVDFIDYAASAGCVGDMVRDLAFIQGYLMGREDPSELDTEALLLRGIIQALFGEAGKASPLEDSTRETSVS